MRGRNSILKKLNLKLEDSQESVDKVMLRNNFLVQVTFCTNEQIINSQELRY